VASWYGVRLLGAGLACMVHAVLPFLCLRTGSATIEHLHSHMTGRLGPLERTKSDTSAAATAQVSEG